MEKRTPHCPLARAKALARQGRFRMTTSAIMGAAEMGLSPQDMLTVVMALTGADFHKSMTTHADHAIWQDVYRPRIPQGSVYLKLTVVDDLLIVSFKEL